MLIQTNQEFCYWLQGYFEISKSVRLTKLKVEMIQSALDQIQEPFGEFTGWLSEMLAFFDKQEYKQKLLDYFLPQIMKNLNIIFLHVIDESYDTPYSHAETQAIHDGVAYDE